MRQNLRRYFKKIIADLSYRAYEKHNLKLILVTGWAGTSTVREVIYHLLKTKKGIRRNTTEVWWDMSVPLSILGYEDFKRTLLQWVILFIRAKLSLLLKPKYSHTLIINLDSSIEDTARFWSKSINPDVVVVLNERPESKVLPNLLSREGIEATTFIYDPQDHHKVDFNIGKEFTFGQGKVDVNYEKVGDNLLIRYKNEKVKIKIPMRSKFIWKYLIPAIAVGANQGIPLKELGESLSSFDYHPKQVERAVSNLKKFVHEDE